MKKVSINDAEVINYYKEHSATSTAKEFNIGKSRLNEILDRNNVEKHSMQESRRLGCLEKFGVDNPSKSPEVIQKIKNTKLERFGSETYVNPEKAKQTNLERYGTSCSLHNPEVSDKVRQTNRERYGTDSYFQSEEFKTLRSEKLEQWMDKTKSTTIARYGSENWFASEVGKQRLREIMREKYGVDYFCQTSMCRKYTTDSKPNLQFAHLLDESGIPYDREFGIGRKQYDFKVGNILIEINPTATHNSTWNPFGNQIDPKYHQEKMLVASSAGYRCINLWDWDDPVKVVNLLQRSATAIYGRECTICEASKAESRDFLETYHMQGYAKSDIQISLTFDGEIVSIMTFGKPRYNKNFEYELVRYCSKSNIVGGCEKLFSYFVSTYQPKSIISYCDLSKFTGKMYENLGFTLSQQQIQPSKHWYNIATGKHITDNLLRSRGFDQLFHTNYGKGSSNSQLMIDNGFVEIYDCGQATYIWKSI